MLGRGFFFFCVCLVLSIPHSAQAARYSGDYLIHVCSSDENGKETVPGGHIACQAYISGVLDYHNLIDSLGTSPSVDFCVPKDVTLYDLQKYIVWYLKKNRSQHGKFIASPGVALALYAKYPCNKAGAK